MPYVDILAKGTPSYGTETKSAVYKVPDSFILTYFYGFPWTLVDSDEAMDGLPDRLYSRGTRLYIVYSTSACYAPAQDRS
jgi:hypothetical protein